MIVTQKQLTLLVIYQITKIYSVLNNFDGFNRSFTNRYFQVTNSTKDEIIVYFKDNNGNVLSFNRTKALIDFYIVEMV